MNNIRYARIGASDKEVYEACKAAAVHDKIMSFPDGKLRSILYTLLRLTLSNRLQLQGWRSRSASSNLRQALIYFADMFEVNYQVVKSNVLLSLVLF